MSPEAAPPVIELRGIDKRFGDVHANRDLSLIVREGTIHGLVGENGAGKSTLMGILYGYHRPDRGADVVYAAAGATGLGVLQAAKDKGRLAIGVDSNQNHIQPGSVLTSMVKRVDLAVFEAFKTAKDGTWKPGVRSLGVAEGGVGYAIDQYNRALITPEMEKRLEQARADIVAGKIKVPDYMAQK